jgi:hypothetical protein
MPVVPMAASRLVVLVAMHRRRDGAGRPMSILLLEMPDEIR